MSLTYFYTPQSSASPVSWTLEELGIPCEKISVDIRTPGKKPAELLKLSPGGRVPLLVHDGVAIFESVAIQIYLGETFGVEKGIYPPPGPRRGEVLKWLVWTNVTLGDALSRIGRNLGGWAPEDERNAKAGATAKADAANSLRFVDEALAGRDYLTGDSITIADFHLASWMQYAGMLQCDLTPYANLNAWIARCTSRPACAKAP